MDVFMEKIVSKKRSGSDYLATLGLMIAGFLVIFIVLAIQAIRPVVPIAVVGVIIGIYYLITSRNIEYEYAVTNGDVDIDIIISQRKRKRIFSLNCKEFEVIAPVTSDKYTADVKNIAKRIEAVSSMDAPDVYFIVANYKGERVVVFFEPEKRMVDSFKTYIPRKVFEQ